MKVSIREAINVDGPQIHALHMRAFPDSENELVADLAVRLLRENTHPDTLSLVAERDDSIVGHVAFSPVELEGNGNWRGYILAPLGVSPDAQRQGIGGKLIEYGLTRLEQSGIAVVLVYGDPDYYGRFGFLADTASDFLPPFDLEYPFGWLAISLRERGVDRGKIRCVGPLNDPAMW